ncbi:unnamed protein product [Acanthosepion pharaonis]|uniref:Uncharacterized protein n=1 Tax=Acanthosepion pharaonis TaxID=158019 RepID=A0A812EWJ3_ACAPH|nr:unnamed protein product [Sepia pharaonis]
MTPPPCGISKQLVSHIQTVLERYGKRLITDAESLVSQSNIQFLFLSFLLSILLSFFFILFVFFICYSFYLFFFFIHMFISHSLPISFSHRSSSFVDTHFISFLLTSILIYSVCPFPFAIFSFIHFILYPYPVLNGCSLSRDFRACTPLIFLSFFLFLISSFLSLFILHLSFIFAFFPIIL